MAKSTRKGTIMFSVILECSFYKYAPWTSAAVMKKHFRERKLPVIFYYQEIQIRSAEQIALTSPV